MADPLSDDRLLGGRVRFSQPVHGYRVAIDPVLLAAAVPAHAGQRILDAGAGSGAASLCLAVRVPGCRILGLEAQRELHRIARHNIQQNRLEHEIDVLLGALERPPPRLAAATFDHVMTNPPHAAAGGTSRSPDAERAAAHAETTLDLAGWIGACLRMLKPDGQLTLIHRADRLDDLLAALHRRVGDIVVFPLWPVADGRPAKRVLVRGRRGSRGPLRLERALPYTAARVASRPWPSASCETGARSI